MSDELMTTKEVADRLRVSRYTIWRWAKDGNLQASKPGGHLRFQRRDVDKLLSRGDTKLGSKD